MVFQARILARLRTLKCWLFLRPRVSGRLKLRGNVDNIKIHPSFRCDGDLWLGVHSNAGSIIIENGVSASGPLIITAVGCLRVGKGVLFGPNVLVTDHYHGNPRSAGDLSMPPSQRALRSLGDITIDANVQIGANAVVLSPATIGASAVIAANAVVKGDVAPMVIFLGIASPSTTRDTVLEDEQGNRNA